MTVVLNEAGLAALFKSVPVTQFVAGVAADVVRHAQSNVRGYYASAPTLNVDQDVGFAMDGSDAVIGIRDNGEKSRRLARYQAQGNSNGVVDWLLDAVDTVDGERGVT